MPSPVPKPHVLKIRQKTDDLIATPVAKTVKELRAAVSAIKKVYYSPLGASRRRKLRIVLDANYAALIELTKSTDAKTARAARTVLPPVLRPKTR